MNLKRLTAIFFTFAALSACGNNEDIRDSLGLTRKAPDEFQVYSRPALTVPPEFELRPPAKGSETFVGQPAQDIAHGKVFSAPSSSSTVDPAPSHFLNVPSVNGASTAVTPVSSSELPTNSDAQFLSNAGATKVDPTVRDSIESDKSNLNKSPYLFGGASGGDPVVDAQKEADRLKQDKAQNKPLTEGETPVVTPEKKSLWDSIF